jgi:hypothetical protein
MPSLTGETALVTGASRGKGTRVVFDPVGGPNFPKLISSEEWLQWLTS